MARGRVERGAPRSLVAGQRLLHGFRPGRKPRHNSDLRDVPSFGEPRGDEHGYQHGQRGHRHQGEVERLGFMGEDQRASQDGKDELTPNNLLNRTWWQRALRAATKLVSMTLGLMNILMLCERSNLKEVQQ